MARGIGVWAARWWRAGGRAGAGRGDALAIPMLGNTVGGTNSFIGGGDGNNTTDDYGVIGGSQGDIAAIWGRLHQRGIRHGGRGLRQRRQLRGLVVVGGDTNNTNGLRAFIGGGYNSQATAVDTYPQGPVIDPLDAPPNFQGTPDGLYGIKLHWATRRPRTATISSARTRAGRTRT